MKVILMAMKDSGELKVVTVKVINTVKLLGRRRKWEIIIWELKKDFFLIFQVKCSRLFWGYAFVQWLLSDTMFLRQGIF